MRFFLPAYDYDWRGNTLASYKRWRVRGAPADSPARILYVCTSSDVVEHIRSVSAGPCLELELPEKRADEFTHRLHFPEGGLPPDELLKHLCQWLTVQVPHLDLVVAADWYNNPPDDGHETWWHTPPGDLVNKAKYRWDTGLNDRARAALAVGLAGMVRAHPLLVGADAIVTVPGHKTGVLACSVDLAQRVAESVGKSVVATTVTSAERPQAKEGRRLTPEELVELSNEYPMPRSLSDLTVIVLDDVLRTGNTMAAVALSARRAGAATVLGLVPARTRKVYGS